MTAPQVAYQSARATVILGDARTFVAALPRRSIDLLATDPPYGKGWHSGRRSAGFDRIDNDEAGDRHIVAEVLRLSLAALGPNRHLYVFGPDDVLDDLKVGQTAPLVWDKQRRGAGDLTAPWAPAHEPITFAVNKHAHASQAGEPSAPARMRKGSVLRYTAPTGRNVRGPSEKPVALMRELIESSSTAGDLVLDPFGGIGSTAVAAILSGRRAITIDTHPGYTDQAIERIRNAEAIADLIATA